MIRELDSKPLSFDARKTDVSILIVDDTESILHLVSHFLVDVADTIEFARNGTEAVKAVTNAIAAEQPFDLVLMDLQMPRVSGFEAARKIRSKGINVPMIAMTAGGIDPLTCLSAGFDGYVSKPFDSTRFLSYITSFLH